MGVAREELRQRLIIIICQNQPLPLNHQLEIASEMDVVLAITVPVLVMLDVGTPRVRCRINQKNGHRALLALTPVLPICIKILWYAHDNQYDQVNSPV